MYLTLMAYQTSLAKCKLNLKAKIVLNIFLIDGLAWGFSICLYEKEMGCADLFIISKMLNILVMGWVKDYELIIVCLIWKRMV